MYSGASRIQWWKSILFGMMLSWITLAYCREDCPNFCACKWKGGKEWVECVGRGLREVPQGIKEETQVLDISRNDLISLPSDCFRRQGLVNLQKLYLAYCNITSIESGAFKSLAGLVELDLSNNNIEHIPSYTFSSCKNLMKLILNDNPIREIRPQAFQLLIHLTTLEMRHCQLEMIERGAFDELHSLEKLKLNDNRLTTVPEMTLPLGGNLRSLTLHNNPWFCDCRLRTLQTWLKNSAPTVPQETEPTCETPIRLKKRQIKNLKATELACIPNIQIQKFVDAYEGSNVSLTCDVDVNDATPTTKVTWWFNGEPCDTRTENDSSVDSTSPFVRYVCKQRGSTNISSILYVYNLELSDEGTYTCIAENIAGSVEANLSLKIFSREKPTKEPPLDQPSTAYVAAIAAGALLGTLFTMSCIISCAFFCTKRHRDRKRNCKSLVPQPNKTEIHPIGKDGTTLPRKGNGNLGFEHQQLVMYEEREQGRGATLEKRKSLENSRRNPVYKNLTEPDLINEVSEISETCGLYERQRITSIGHHILGYDTRYCMQLDLRPDLPRISYLDQDGYPMDFGLPKIAFTSTSTLPRPRQRILDGSAAALPAQYSREAEFLTRLPHYDIVVPKSDSKYTTECFSDTQHQSTLQPLAHQFFQSQHKQQHMPPSSMLSAVDRDVHFIPPPPVAYRGEPTPLSPRSLLCKTAREAAATIAIRAEAVQQLENTESPDEGYVGETMDV